MTEQTHHIVVSYDIRDDKRLIKVGKIMKDYGERVLLSVWECNLNDDQFERMKTRLENVIEHMEDSIRYYFLCDKCIRNVQVSGLGTGFKHDQSFIIT
ncbi:MAG: CRISPR-associated endonuclease Cas2 [Deltaproteobacteria bacterium]|nr:MAG: CRISPR-associated endonuclease Cas2 [Deltaproteobacteria bacterium]